MAHFSNKATQSTFVSSVKMQKKHNKMTFKHNIKNKSLKTMRKGNKNS